MLEFQDYLKTHMLIFDEKRGVLHTYPARLSVDGDFQYTEHYEVLCGYIVSWLISIGTTTPMSFGDKKDSKDFALKFIKWIKSKEGFFISNELDAELKHYYKTDEPYNISLEHLELAVMDTRCDKDKL